MDIFPAFKIVVKAIFKLILGFIL